MKDGIRIKGCMRIRLGEERDGKQVVVGDSGWVDNMVTNLGVKEYIIDELNTAGGLPAATLIIGTGTAPASNATALAGTTAQSSGSTSVVASRTHQVTNAWTSGDHPGGTPTIQNAALANQGTGSYTILCGGTYATSVWNSNQALSVTYQLRFPTS